MKVVTREDIRSVARTISDLLFLERDENGLSDIARYLGNALNSLARAEDYAKIEE